ncbi:MAG: ArsR/SmtB family transcription factor [Solirubrobacteraceae bacterium]
MSHEVMSGPAPLSEPIFDGASGEFFAQEPEKLKVLAHPIRMKILKQAQLGEVSAKEASRDLEEPIGKVSYHVRVLAEAGLLELTRQTPRRGAIESHYRATVSMHLDDATWQAVGRDVRRLMLAAAAKEWSADLHAAVESGGFELDEALLANAHFAADAKGLDELREALDAHYRRLLEIEASIAARMAGDPEAEVTEVNVGVAFYEGAKTPAANAPFFARSGGVAYPLIPEYIEDH